MSPNPPPEVIQLWFHYEEVAMHFNELIMQYRLQLMGGIGATGALSGYLIGGKVEDPERRRWLRALVSSILLLLFCAAATLDIFYYNELLQGAVDALIALEARYPSINMSTLIAKRVACRGVIPIYVSYALLFLGLAAFTFWSWWSFVKGRGVDKVRRDA